MEVRLISQSWLKILALSKIDCCGDGRKVLTSVGSLDGSYLLGGISDLGSVASPGGLVLCVVVHVEGDQVDVDVSSCEQRHCKD